MKPIPSTITDPAATRFLFDRDPGGGETDAYKNDRVLIDQDEYQRRLQLAYEEGFAAGEKQGAQDARLKARNVAYRLLATLES